MAITIRSELTGGTTTNASDGTFSVTKPASVQNGDLLVVIIGKQDEPNVASPGGTWVTGAQGGSATGNDRWGGIYYKWVTNAAGEPASYTFDSEGTSEQVGWWIGALSNVDTVTPEDVDFDTGSGMWAALANDTSPACPAVTAASGGLAFACWAVNTDSATDQPGGSWAARADDVGGNGVLNVASQTIAALAGTGTPELTNVASGMESMVGMFIFREQAAIVKSLTDTATGAGDRPTISASSSKSDVGAGSDSILIAKPGTRYWVGGSGNWSDAANHWSNSSSGTANSIYLPTKDDDVVIDSFSGFSSGGTISFTGNGNCKDFTCSSGHTFTITAGSTRILYVYGSIALEAGITWGSNVQINLSSSNIDETITSAGVTLGGIVFDGAGGKWTFLDNLTSASVTVSNGTFDANDRNITVDTVTLSVLSAEKIVTVYMGSGTWTLNGSWYTNEFGGAVATIYCETSKMIFTAAATFDANGKTYYDVEFQNNISIIQEDTSDNATFHDITFTENYTYRFSGTKTYVITGTFTAVGSAGNLITITNVGGTNRHILSKSSGTVACDYLDVFYSEAIGGAAWYAGSHSTDEGTNVGWIFSDPSVLKSLTDASSSLDNTSSSASSSLSEYGLGTDNASLSASLSLNEYSQGIDNLILLASLFSYEVGSGTDIESITRTLAKYVNDIVLRIFSGTLVSVSDSGTISETSAISAVLSLTEQGLTLEQISQIASLIISELGYGIDSSQLASSLGISDVGTILDYLGLSASLTLSDIGTIIDVASTIASLQILESALGTDRLSNLTASLALIDSGYGTDAVSVLVSLLILVADTGSGSDQVLNLLASLSVSELSTVLEALTQLVSLTLSETGRGIDTSALAASLGLSDTVLAGDFLGLSAVDIINEFASGSDTLPALLASLGVEETGSMNDLLSLLASLSLSDIGSGSDVVNVLTAILKTISDAASGIDGVSISASMSLIDNGSGVDNLSLSVSLTIRDTGIGTDAISVLISAIKQILDTASGIDGLTISASLNIPEPAYGIDTPTIAASITGYDISIGSDSPQIQASLTLTDTSSASDILNILQTALKIVQDLASGSDFIGSISANIPVTETILGIDQIAQILASLMVTDLGTGVDVVIHYDITTQIIKISFIIKKSAITFAFACPRIEFGLSKRQVEFSFLDGG